MSVSADRLRLLRRQAGHADVRAPAVVADGDALQAAVALNAKEVETARGGEVTQPASGAATQGRSPAPGDAPRVSAERLRLLRRQVGGLTPASRKDDAVMPTRAQRAAVSSTVSPAARLPSRDSEAARHDAAAARPHDVRTAPVLTRRALQSATPAPPARDASVFAWVEHDVRHKPALPSAADAITAVATEIARHSPMARSTTTPSAIPATSTSPVPPPQRRTDIAGLRKMIGLRERAVSAHTPVRAPSNDRHLPGTEIAPGLHLIEAFLPQAIPCEALSLAFAKRDDAVDPRDLLFFDTETTGLAGGTGTRAFMIGAADWYTDAAQGSGLRVRQLMMSTMAAESAMLDLFRTWLSPRTVLSSYNGRCYDAPLLKTRYRLARRGDPLSALDHVDLLFPTRRRYRGNWENCKLATIERQLLRVVRDDDLPGSEAPAAWLSYLRGGSARNLRRVAEHNHQDVVTLSLLMQRLVAVEAQDREVIPLMDAP
ncbi:ribonuclease H-like domain-containing protein [Xanthomonas nasturtii]|uniref:ribonuclease H-like domain-containing protein n=1 Tax=Xanthomonas nasturtii TaxID=1843581 RepID=UPI002012AE19|nr:ribonuclease H-like domain-containing protein [Xanthomonas nasturtii]MCL1526354.1 ribonuclease H-like domain-containing protein [Xanthomonas nasturtii]MCL1533995.1 ribonuclease H-like domain-containing protein [Xanthomonas nasturtii]MCL1543663.1 ribonuclease H-like domain-containing protein [Xanthomonas nasturtii]